MTAADLVVRGGTLANGERADVAIADGRIVAIARLRRRRPASSTPLASWCCRA